MMTNIPSILLNGFLVPGSALSQFNSGSSSWMYHGMMWSWTGWFGGIFMILLSVVILVVVLIAIRRLMESGGRTGPASRPGRETALDILKKRYARGEISREQFESMRRDIES